MDADFLVLVHALDDPTGSFAANAISCRDSIDNGRPVVGEIRFNKASFVLGNY